MSKEIKPKKLEVTIEEAKAEKQTEEKMPTDTEEDLEGNSTIKKLEDLNGIGPRTAEKLRELGYTVVGLATGRAEEVAAEMKVSYSVAKGWVMQASEAVLAKMTMKTAIDQDKEKKAKQLFIQTGSKGFNEMIGGGIPTMSITGLTGRLASGKTQIVNDAIVDCLGRLKEIAVFIETEPDTFNLDRLKEIAKLRNLDCDWSRLYIMEAKQIPTAKAQFLQYKVVQKALEKGEKIRLVCVDSMNAKFRAGWSRSEMLPVRTREFAEHFNLMEYLAAKYNIAWLLTFQVIAPPRPDQGLAAKVKFVDQFYPVGGDFVLHSVNNWVALQQIKTELWEASLFDSSHVKRGSCFYMLTASGLKDGIK
jgi:DNA repair protein RadA